MNINKLSVKNGENTYVDENGKELRKVRTKDYVVMADGEAISGTAMLFSTGEHGWRKYVDVEHGIEGEMHWSVATAKRFFEDRIENHIGKIYWAR